MDEEEDAIGMCGVCSRHFSEKGKIMEDKLVVSFKESCSREICKACYQINAVGFKVPVDVWKAAVPESLEDRVLCLSCFIRFADADGS